MRRSLAVLAILAGSLSAAAPARAVSPLLFDNSTATSSAASSSQDFETAFNAYDTEIADDFVVPAGANWTIDQVEADGLYTANSSSTAGPAAAFNVRFYADDAGKPATTSSQGTSVTNYTPSGASTTARSYVMPLASPVVLGPGHYWVSVQSRQDYGTRGQWFWYLNPSQKGSVAMYRNPGLGFANGCATWSPRGGCTTSAGVPDQSFRLRGTTAAVVDTTKPTCVVTSTTNTVPKRQTVRVSDAGSGIATIGNLVIENGSTQFPAFAQGDKTADVITTKADQSRKTTYGFTVKDVAGNTTNCR